MRNYIVTFGNSAKYVVHDNEQDARRIIDDAARDIDYRLHHQFPEHEDLRYYYTPRVEEATAEEKEHINEYPVLDKAAVDDIYDALATEVEANRDIRDLNRNAPFDDI